MTIEDRVTKLEKAVFNSVVGKLVVNKEGKMEKELLKNGYTEKQILDMQKGMINFITDGGKKPLDIPVIPVVVLMTIMTNIVISIRVLMIGKTMRKRWVMILQL